MSYCNALLHQQLNCFFLSCLSRSDFRHFCQRTLHIRSNQSFSSGARFSNRPFNYPDGHIIIPMDISLFQFIIRASSRNTSSFFLQMPDADYPLGNIARLTSSTQQQGGALNTLIWRVTSVVGCCRFVAASLVSCCVHAVSLTVFHQGAALEHGIFGISK